MTRVIPVGIPPSVLVKVKVVHKALSLQLLQPLPILPPTIIITTGTSTATTTAYTTTTTAYTTTSITSY